MTWLPAAVLFVAGLTAAEPPRHVAYAWQGDAGRHPGIIPAAWLTRESLGDPARLAAATARMPKGHRIVMLSHITERIHSHPGNRTVWLEAGADAVAAELDRFLAAYRGLGAELDGIVLDHEIGLSNWALGDREEPWKSIQADERFPALAAKLGFDDLGGVRNWRSSDRYLRWNALMSERMDGYLERAVLAPLRRHFPAARLSNYGGCARGPAWPVPDEHGHAVYRFAHDDTVGTHQSPVLYANLINLSGNPPPGAKAYPHTPFNAFRYAVNLLRAAAAASPAPLWPWVAYRTWRPDSGIGITRSDLYQEVVLHAGLVGVDAFLLWNPRPWHAGQSPGDLASDDTDASLSACLAELDAVVGAPGRKKPLSPGLADWNEDFVVTGAVAGNRRIWRLTVDPAAVPDIAAAAAQGPDPAFRIGPRTLVFPGARLLPAGKDGSKFGRWLVGGSGPR